jgi:diacylglycerol kinase family enzyme
MFSVTSDSFLIINPNSRSGKTGKRINRYLKLIKEYLGEIEYKITTKPRDETNLAKEAVEKGYKTILSLGGDGTATNIGDVLVKHPDTILGYLSAGSMNDWGRTHSIPTKFEECLQVIVEGHHEKFPGMRCVGDREYYAFDHVDGGFVAEAGAAALTEARWLRSGFLKYAYLALKYVIKFKNVAVRMKIDNQEPLEIDDLSASVFAFSDAMAGFKMLPGNDYLSRKNKDIGIVIARGLKGFGRIGLVLKTSSGKHAQMDGVWFSRGKKIEVESERSLAWEAEGEVFNEEGTKVTIEYLEDALNLIVPKEREYNEEVDENLYTKSYHE